MTSSEDVFQIAEILERSHNEMLQFENTRLRNSGVNETQTDSKTKLSAQGGIGRHPYKGSGHQCRQCFFRGKWGHKPTVWPCFPGCTGTDAKANSYAPPFPIRRGNQRLGMKLTMSLPGSFGGGNVIAKKPSNEFGGGNMIAEKPSNGYGGGNAIAKKPSNGYGSGNVITKKPSKG